MKRLLMMVIVVAAAVACFGFGASSFVVRASSMFSADTYHVSPNYFFLSNPLMLTTDGNNAFVVNGKTVDEFELIALNTTGALELPAPTMPLGDNLPEFIKHAGDYVFLFYKDGFSAVYLDEDDFEYRTVSLVQYFGTEEFSFFDVTTISTGYRVFFANETEYGWSDFNLEFEIQVATSLSPTEFTTSFSDEEITAISTDGTRFLYICVAEDIGHGESAFYIHQLDQTSNTSTQVNKRAFFEITSFSAVQNRNLFVYINQNNSLTLFNGEDEFQVQRGTDYNTGTSRRPIFATTEGQNFVYVIDRAKRSIDRYTITGDGASLVYNKTIAGYRGGDSGFFNRPTSMTLVNSSKRHSVLESSEYLVTDRAGQVMYNSLHNNNGTVTVTSKRFFADPNMRLSDNARATYDGFDTVYIYDYDATRQINRIRTFGLNGESNSREFTGFGARVTDMFADNNRTVFVLDSTAARNSIYYYAPSTMSATAQTMPALPAFETAKTQGYALTQWTKGVYNQRLDAIILTSVQKSGNLENIILPLDTDKDITALDVDVSGRDIINVTVDALGNIIVLTFEDDEYFLGLYELAENLSFETTPEWEDEIEHATVDHANASLNFDIVNRRVLYVGTRHAIEAFELPSEAETWSPIGHTIDEASWKNNSVALGLFDRDDGDSIPVFAKSKVDVVIYQYPHNIRARALAPKGSIFKVLNASTNYILYENAKTGEHIAGYVSGKFVDFELADEPYTTPTFKAARVIFSHTQVLKYPTSDRRLLSGSQTLTLHTNSQPLALQKNYEQAIDDPGLRLFRKVVSTDVRGFSFYEIRLVVDDGKLKPAGTHINNDVEVFVGYINANNVIDYDLAPSTRRFVPNATIRILPSHYTTKVQIYERVGADEFVPIEHETLSHKRAIRIVGKFDKTSEYTYINYNDDVIGHTRDGWIKTKYIVPNGLSAVQLIAIAALALVVLGIVTYIVVRIRKRMV
jgi:hypothetical protein